MLIILNNTSELFRTTNGQCTQAAHVHIVAGLCQIMRVVFFPYKHIQFYTTIHHIPDTW
jgi:hypothetical protein